MASVFHGGVAKPKPSKRFEISLDSPFVVFDGLPHEAEPSELTGSLILENPDHVNVRSIKIKLLGKWRVSWFVEPMVSTLQIRDTGTMIEEETVLYPTDGASTATTHKIAPGCHEWRFKFTLQPDLWESVEGLPGSYIVYDLAAEIDRGYISKSLIARKHVRVIRTLGRDLTDTVPLPYCNEDTWRDKIWYRVYLPSRFYIYGTHVTVDFTLCPLQKGLTIGKIRMEVVEKVTLHTETGRFKTGQMEKVVASTEQDLPEASLQPMREETTGIPDESYHFKITLPLEKSLNRARQSVDTEHIKIAHNLRIYVNLHNPDGHVSQLLVRNLITLFISPNLPIGEDQVMCADQTQISQVSQAHEGGPEAPPTYGRHQLDQLYDEIDTNAFTSGISTPYHHQSFSRSASDENLRAASVSWGGAADGSDAAALENRLAALQMAAVAAHEIPNGQAHGSEESSPAASPNLNGDIQLDAASHAPHAPAGRAATLPIMPASSSSLSSLRHFAQSLSHSRRASGQGAPAAAASPSRRDSQAPDGIAATPAAVAADYDMDALARIPSYNTAVRTPPVPVSAPDRAGLPTYETAVSNPSSPTQTALRPPPRAHTRTSSEGSISLGLLSECGGQSGTVAGAGSRGDTAASPTIPPEMPANGGMQTTQRPAQVHTERSVVHHHR